MSSRFKSLPEGGGAHPSKGAVQAVLLQEMLGNSGRYHIPCSAAFSLLHDDVFLFRIRKEELHN